LTPTFEAGAIAIDDLRDRGGGTDASAKSLFCKKAVFKLLAPRKSKRLPKL
jgi:hypothetical protein